MDDQSKMLACEGILRDHRFTQCQVTLHGEMVKIRISTQEFERFFETTLRERVVQKLKNVGFSFVSLDLEGLPSQPALARDK